MEYSSTSTYADFSYGPNRERVRTTEHEGSAERVIYHVGPHFEVETSTAYTGTHYRSTVFFGERAVYARVDGPSAPLEEGYLHQDHQGSLDRVTAVTGSAAQSSSFDAFGKRRNATTWANDNTDALFAETQWLERGYTGHQQLDGVRLIHMNGRVQNPTWGRMLSPDPVVGDLTRPQSLNAYSYVMNNPLSYVDPTGYAPACPADCKPPPPCGGSICTVYPVDSWSAVVKTDTWVDDYGNKSYDSYIVAIVHRTADVGSDWVDAMADYYEGMDREALLARWLTVAGAIPIYKPWIGVPVVGKASRFTNPISGAGIKAFPQLKIGTQILGTNRVFGLVGRLNVLGATFALSFDATSIALSIHLSDGQSAGDALNQFILDPLFMDPQ